MRFKACSALLLAALLAGSLTACGTAATADVGTQTDGSSSAQETINAAFGGIGSGSAAETASYETAGTGDWFTDRDLEQTPDLTGAAQYTVKDGQDIEITAAGVYVISGTAKNVTIVVDAGDEDKVQLVLDGLTLTNEDAPCIYGKNADKIFVTTTDSENSLTVSGTFAADGDVNTDAVIFSRDDLVLNGVGTLTISSTDNGISSKDDLKVTGGTLVIDCAADGLEANESVAVGGGTLTITAEKDGIHAENDEDDAAGAVYIGGGTLTVTAGSDAIRGTTAVRIDDGTMTLKAAEGIEGTYVVINGGTIAITASDDGINAARKSAAVDAAVEINGGDITISMGAGDTDAIDSNGDLTITGGTLDITGNSPFDYDGTAAYTGGTLIVNGQETDEITNQFGGQMGPGMGGGFQNGQMPGGGTDQWADGQTGQRSDPSGETDGTTGATPDFPDDWEEDLDGWDRPPQGGMGGGYGGMDQGGTGYGPWGTAPSGGTAVF